MTDRPTAVISDANVLIDYISVKRTKVLRLVSEHLFQIKLPRSILNEVDQLDQAKPKPLAWKSSKKPQIKSEKPPSMAAHCRTPINAKHPLD